MPATSPLTIQLTPETEARLARLAERTNHAPSVLAADAITQYVSRESGILDGIARGLADRDAGRLVPHDEAMARLDAAITRVEREKV